MNSRNHMAMQKCVIFVKKILKISMLKIKNIVKLGTIVIIQGNIDVLHVAYLKYSVPKRILIVFHNGSNYDYHFIINELKEELEGKIICLGENTEKYINLSVPIEKKVIRIDKKGKEVTKTMSHRLQFIYSARFIASPS